MSAEGSALLTPVAYCDLVQAADGWLHDLPVLRPTSRIELWVQLRDQLAERILDGRIPPDHKLWSQQELAEALGVSRGTTIRSYEALQEMGLVVLVPGKGIYSPMPDEITEAKKKLNRAASR
jgi:DNA-binding GntR family transcriptional regulator